MVARVDLLGQQFERGQSNILELLSFSSLDHEIDLSFSILLHLGVLLYLSEQLKNGLEVGDHEARVSIRSYDGRLLGQASGHGSGATSAAAHWRCHRRRHGRGVLSRNRDLRSCWRLVTHHGRRSELLGLSRWLGGSSHGRARASNRLSRALVGVHRSWADYLMSRLGEWLLLLHLSGRSWSWNRGLERRRLSRVESLHASRRGYGLRNLLRQGRRANRGSRWLGLSLTNLLALSHRLRTFNLVDRLGRLGLGLLEVLLLRSSHRRNGGLLLLLHLLLSSLSRLVVAVVGMEAIVESRLLSTRREDLLLGRRLEDGGLSDRRSNRNLRLLRNWSSHWRLRSDTSRKILLLNRSNRRRRPHWLTLNSLLRVHRCYRLNLSWSSCSS